MFTLKDNYIIVNYHYVEDLSPKFSGIVPCALADFEKQIKFLSENYAILSVEEVCEAARAGQKGKFCAIAFDDGLKDQYKNALPILEKYKTFGIFFPITSVFQGRLPTAHKTHILLSRLSAGKAVDVFNDFLSEFYPDLKDRYFIPKDRRLTNKRMHEDPITANFKETLIVLAEDIKNRFLRHGFKTFRLNEKKISENLFMNPAELQQLKKRGMRIGNHSHHHYAFDTVNKEVLQTEINLAQEILGQILGTAPVILSYPHGRYSEAAAGILKSEGFRYALTIDRRGISAKDDNFSIPRYDTMDLKDFLTRR